MINGEEWNLLFFYLSTTPAFDRCVRGKGRGMVVVRGRRSGIPFRGVVVVVVVVVHKQLKHATICSGNV
jgi:hypothetical protein